MTTFDTLEPSGFTNAYRIIVSVERFSFSSISMGKLKRKSP